MHIELQQPDPDVDPDLVEPPELIESLESTVEDATCDV